MSTFCLQCALKAVLDHAPTPPVFEETPDEHLRRVHFSPQAAYVERLELESRFRERVATAVAALDRDG